MLNPRQVEAFRAVMITGSMTSAGEMMHITQPAVSRLIRDFELGLGLVLFERRGNRLDPTAEASHLFEEVERTFVGFHRVAQFAEELRMRRAGSLRLAAMPAIATGFLPRVVGRFLVRRPEVAVSINGIPSHQVASGVAAGQFDIGIGAAPIDRPGLAIETLPAKALAAIPQGDPLADREVIGPKDIEGRSFIATASGTLFRSRVDGALAGVRRQQLIETALTEIACSLVAENAGLSLVDPFSASEFVGRGVVFRPFRPTVFIDLVILTPQARAMPTIATDFLGVFRSAAQALL